MEVFEILAAWDFPLFQPINPKKRWFIKPINYPIGSMYAVYGNIHHQYTPNVSINLPYMDPMGISSKKGPASQIFAATWRTNWGTTW